VHAAVGVRLHGGRLHPGVLPHGVGVQAVPVAPPQGPPQLLGVHPGRRRPAAQREDRGRAPVDPSGHGGADAGGGDQVHPEGSVRRPQVEVGAYQGHGRRRRRGGSSTRWRGSRKVSTWTAASQSARTHRTCTFRHNRGSGLNPSSQE
jgi:hypothetical protein